FLRVAARFRVAQPSDAIDEPVELIGLEREDPLPITEPERARRVRKDLGELAAHHTVLCEELGTLLARQEVPLRRTDERVDAEVGARTLTLQERGLVIRRELGGPDHPHERPR